MKRKIILIPFMLFILIGTSAHGATFKGRVIDADTKEPIEGAVVVAEWGEQTVEIGATHTRVKDLRETLTDKNGQWEIKGPRGREMGNITTIISLFTGAYFTLPPQFIVFKPGYCSWPAGFGIDVCKGKIKPVGNHRVAKGDTVELPKLTNKQDRLKALPHPIHKSGDMEFYKKQRNLLRLIDEESRFLGIPEYKILKEQENEK